MKKTLAWWKKRGYLYNPTVSFLLETHNMAKDAISVIKGLRKFKDAEIIVMDDGSSHNHTKLLLDELSGVNEFLLHANDLFSVLTMNRACYFARGKYIAKIQDDDEYVGTGWVNDAVALFEKYPDLMVLGGRTALSFPANWEPPRKPNRNRCFQGFRFVQAINEAPMWIRRADFIELGGLDEDFAPLMYSEVEISFRAWLAGKSVGWYGPNVKRHANKTAGRRATKRPLLLEAYDRNKILLHEKFSSELGNMCAMVRQRNRKEFG